MRKLVPLIIITFIIFSYIGCSKTSNPVTPSNNSVTFKMSHQNVADTIVYFFTNPSVNVVLNYEKGTGPTGDTASFSNLNVTLSKDSIYNTGFFTRPNVAGVYTFNFRGTIVSGGATYNVTAKDSL